ncbi:hypothetical protein [Cryptosporangium sp. NPDC051539]|uniref:hypothetical protein n=1 Tax=Cryptosporangium sp. NPDC051539 TaxID=3363962 RepID=UPI0037AEF57F
MSRRRFLQGAVGALGALTVGAAAEPPAPTRTLSLGFDDVLTAGRAPDAARNRIALLGATAVAVTAGRADWTTFRWADRPSARAAQIARAGTDPFGVVVTSVEAGRTVVAVIDVLAERLLAGRPELAARDAHGVASPLRPSLTALAEGEVGDRVVAMADYVLGHYPVQAINLTELDFYEFGYGPDDLREYRRATGAADWPRRPDGSVDIDAEPIGVWRSGQVAAVIRRVAEVTRRHRASLLVDARVSWPDLSRRGREFGQHYPTLLAAADQLVLWYLPGLSGHPATVERLLATLPENERRRYVLSVGLWSDTGASVPDRLGDAVRAAEGAGLGGTWVTPYGLLGPGTEHALRRAWSRDVRV